MKKNTHPKFFAPITVKCSKCEATFIIGSTQENLPLSMCSQCHPVYSGKNTYADTSNRISRFKNRQSKVISVKSPDKPQKKQLSAKSSASSKSTKASV